MQTQKKNPSFCQRIKQKTKNKPIFLSNAKNIPLNVLGPNPDSAAQTQIPAAPPPPPPPSDDSRTQNSPLFSRLKALYRFISDSQLVSPKSKPIGLDLQAKLSPKSNQKQLYAPIWNPPSDYVILACLVYPNSEKHQPKHTIRTSENQKPLKTCLFVFFFFFVYVFWCCDFCFCFVDGRTLFSNFRRGFKEGESFLFVWG